MSARTLTYPAVGLGAPKHRQPGPIADVGLPAGTEVFSADNHISLSEDIFHERFPESMKDRAPRVMDVEGAWVIGVDGRSVLVPEFIEVLTQYDPLPGSHSGDVDARLAALESEGVVRELAFPNAVIALFGWPDKEVRERCFRIYNEHIAEVQERSGNRIYGVGLINWWDADGARRTLTELKDLGLKTFLLPLSPGKDDEKRPIDYSSTAMDGVWDAIEESGLPVSHHIGESPPASPNQFNAVGIGMLQSVAPFRDTFGKYILGGILDRHPGLQVGFFEGGINWVPSAIQDAQHIAASFRHLGNLEVQHDPAWYWEQHLWASFMVDPLGLDLIDRIGAHKVMWSTDFPHNESTYGYSNESLASVVDAVGPDAAAQIVEGNVKRFLGIEP
jgi:predicted TIM-barrel fold metal-dependent hydrolase